MSNKEVKAMMMFNKLREHIGEEVSYVIWINSEKKEGTGKLTNVDDFHHACIGGMGIPFAGPVDAISTIKSKDGKILYRNTHIKDNYSKKSQEELWEFRKLIFGKKIANKEMKKILKFEKRIQEAIRREDEEALKDKNNLIERGALLVKPELVDDWKEFADINTNNGYSAYIIRAVVSMMEKFEEDIPFAEAERQVYADELGLSGAQASLAANTLIYYSKYGESYQVYWNGDEPSKETVNKAALQLTL